MNRSFSRFSIYAWGVLAYNVMVILFGAFVRATGSGAGCGAHWPLCNGVVIPRPQQVETIIEFTHRLTSGITLILVLALVIWTWRKYPKGNLLRWSSGGALLFTITEALVGAGLVLYGWVAKDTSGERAVSVMIHLVNTFLLVGCLTTTAWWSTHGAPERLKSQGSTGALLAVGALAILLLGASGAVTALGDTLFPASSLAEGVQQDFSPTAHFLIRMRIFHPAIAMSVGIYLTLATLWVRQKMMEPRIAAITTALFVIYGLQIFLGFTNIALLAPVWMQIVHLLVSNLVWITYVLMFTVSVSSTETSPRPVHQEVDHPVGEIAK